MKNAPVHLTADIQLTADGSHTLFVPSLDEHYHSVNGAITESVHIFIRSGLHHSHVKNPRILEIGFGTGLNAFLTLLETERLNKTVEYTTLELYPIEVEKIRLLNYPEKVSPGRAEDYYRLHEVTWNENHRLTSCFSLYKIQADFTSYIFCGKYDIIYFDAFAPDKQPEMWSQSLFDRLFACMNEGGILTTYCAKGVVRRILQTAGFQVERLPGPPGKREILRATKLE